jgi:hypothetical protein
LRDRAVQAQGSVHLSSASHVSRELPIQYAACGGNVASFFERNKLSGTNQVGAEYPWNGQSPSTLPALLIPEAAL